MAPPLRSPPLQNQSQINPQIPNPLLIDVNNPIQDVAAVGTDNVKIKLPYSFFRKC